MPKNAEIFGCEICNFKCSKKSNYNKHLLTAKHKKFTKFTEKNAELNNKYICDICDKHYTSRMGLWKHKQKCIIEEHKRMTLIQEDEEHILLPNSENTITTMMELIKQNQEFKELIVEQNKQLVELAQKPTTLNNNQTINNNQKFNLNVFLNEQCKDAINMSDFIENMELDIEDLTETGRLGYVGGISRILINKLQELDIYKRPLHCTDMKRETLYIKENDEWSKENNSKEKMSSLIGKVANKNCRNLNKWTNDHPEYQVFDSIDNMEYINLTQAVLGGLGEQECKQFKDKIIRGVIKEVMVNKI
jgi:hypothetical protein